MSKLKRSALIALGVFTMIPALVTVAASSAHAATYAQLTLTNGWTAYGNGTRAPSVTNIANVITFRGAISSGTTGAAFTLPAADTPSTDVYVPVDLCNATNGRLHITSTGVVDVEAEGDFSNAQCFTSLEGASFALHSASDTPLTLENGWTNAPFATSNAAVREVNGIVHFEGAIAGGSSAGVFSVPAAMAPATDVYIPVDLCDATNGRLHITPSGAVDVEAEGGTFSNAQCFVSLDGASYAPSATGFTNLTLLNGWTNAPFATSNAAAEDVSAVVHLKGAIATTGTNTEPFQLPLPLRPTDTVYVKADLCNSTNGRLVISPSGVVTVQAEGGTFSNAQCFTSLDGISFPSTGYKTLVTQNGWTPGPFNTRTPGVATGSGIVSFQGAIATGGTNAFPFTLPVGFRPPSDVYVPIDLCNATNGRLHITPAGVVDVEAEGGTFSNAQCFTSLDGASFSSTSSQFTPLTLINGWTNAPFSTSNAAARNIGGIVHLEGAVATSGSSPDPFVLPVGMRPATDVYVKVDLCDSTNGRLHITPAGVVDVEAEGGTFSNAQCFTSLDGASFAVSAAGFTPLSLINGWTNGPFSTANAAAEDFAGIVQLEGAIATSGTNSEPFVLPSRFRPSRTVYVPVDMCGATNGRLVIQANGDVTAAPESSFSNAACFTSLDGVTYAL